MRFIQRSWAAPVALLLVLGWASPALPSTEPPFSHEVLSPAFGGKTSRMHRFRLRVAELRAEVFDLAFKLPVRASLGDGQLAINGGYWEWHRGKARAIGWVVSNGKQVSPLRKKLDGGVLIIQHAKARIERAAGLSTKTHGIELAVQCRPRLVEANRVVPQLNTKARAARTAVCIRDGGRTLDAYLSEPGGRSPTLAELGTWLVGQGCTDALNLDGGPSTAAVFRGEGGVSTIGPGLGLPYAIRFVRR